ncbi:MAG: hypothetical protein PGN13_09500 [Patulibacter minatonensis]
MSAPPAVLASRSSGREWNAGSPECTWSATSKLTDQIQPASLPISRATLCAALATTAT